MVELLVTIIIAAIFFAAAVPLFANAIKAASADTMRVAAQSIAQQKMEEIRALEFNQLTKLTDTRTDFTTWMGGRLDPTVLSYVGTAAKTYTVTYGVLFAPANASPTDAQYARVTVDVSWADAFKTSALPGAPRRTGHVILATSISRQFGGPGVNNVTLSQVNGLRQLVGAPTTITVYITPQDAGVNNSNIGAVEVVVADVNNATFAPLTLTATAVSNGVFTTSWDQTGATANDTYSFTAQATATNGAPGNPFSVRAKLITGQEPAPVNAFSIAAGDGRLLLTWDNSTASDFNHYEIWRGSSLSSMTPLVTNLRASGYLDSNGLANGTTYYYKVRVVDNDGNNSGWVTLSAAPAAPTDTTVPEPPGNFTAVRDTANANLSWTVPTAGAAGIAGYFIYRDGASLPYARVSPGGIVGDAVNYAEIIGYSVAHTYSVVAFDGVGFVSDSTPTLSVLADTPPVQTLTVTTTNTPLSVAIAVVQTDALPDPLDWGTKTATFLTSAFWTGLPYGSYTITATYNGSQIIQSISLFQNTTVASGF